MEEHLSLVEQGIVRIDATLATVATKTEVEGLRTELHKGFSEMVKCIVGTAVLLGVAGITVMTFVLNNAVPKSAGVSAAAPAILINVPPAPGAAAPAASR